MLFNMPSEAEMAMSQAQLLDYRSHKHELFGLQEGKCNGCEYPFYFRNMTIDHIKPQSKSGTDRIDNLQMLCGACNSTKGSGHPRAVERKTQRYWCPALSYCIFADVSFFSLLTQSSQPSRFISSVSFDNAV